MALLALGFLLAGCSNLGYYAQAVGGHLEVLSATHPIDAIVLNPASDPVLAKKLADVQAIRNFASAELGLPDNASYRSYADLGLLDEESANTGTA